MNGEENMMDAPQEMEAAQQTEDAAAAQEAAQEALAGEIRQLHRDGWSAEQLEALAQDAQAICEMAQGASVRQAATAYLMRRAGEDRSLPAMRAGAAGGFGHAGRMAQMSDAEFARFSDEAYQRLMAGEKIRL